MKNQIHFKSLNGVKLCFKSHWFVQISVMYVKLATGVSDRDRDRVVQWQANKRISFPLINCEMSVVKEVGFAQPLLRMTFSQLNNNSNI